MTNQTTEVTTNLYINPSYITGRYDVARKPRSKLQQNHTISNFTSNNHRGKISKQSKRKIRMAIQWMVLLAEKKKVWDRTTAKFIDYKAGLLTVSLPTGCTNVSEIFFRDTLLTSILSASNYQWGLANYVWKIERQKNGTLHAHITVDKFIDHRWLLSKWCTILDKHGLLEEYRSKFNSMTGRDYIDYRKRLDHMNYRKKFKSEIDYVKSLVNAYKKGEENNWSRPNCTDIHAVKNIRSLASYMVKYMSKDPNLGENFKGRYWSSSHSLSKLKSITVSLPEKDLPKFTRYIEPSTTGLEDIYYLSKIDGEPHFLGCIYFLKRSLNELYSNPFLNQLFGLIRSLYHSSRLDDLPYLSLEPCPTHSFTFKTKYPNAN